MSWRDTSPDRNKLYGRRWRSARLHHLNANPLCIMCLIDDNRPTPATVVDHIVPHRGDVGLFWDRANWQSLCKRHHDSDKQLFEGGGQGRITIGADGWPEHEVKRFGYSIPHGIEPSGIPLIIVSGPPASGKSTYIQQRATLQDVVIDFDKYLKAAGHKKWTQDKRAVSKAFKERDADLRTLSMRKIGQAWMIVTAPTAKERAAWLTAMGPLSSCILLDVSADECKRRVTLDADRQHAAERMNRAIDDWWRAFTR